MFKTGKSDLIDRLALPLRRRSDWVAALESYLIGCSTKHFRYGDIDCALFAADWVQVATGVDLAAEYRGKYACAFGAARALKEIAHGGLIEAATRALGNPLAAPEGAHRGDIALAPVVTETGRVGAALAIVDLSGARLVALGPSGLTRAPLTQATLAWSVG